MRYLAIDYGTRRWGLAHADEVPVAFPLAALTQPTEAERWAALAQVVAQRRPQALVVGYPYNMDGTVGEMARGVDVFIEKLTARFGLPVHRADERLTSEVAAEGLRALRGASPRQQRHQRATGQLDSRAAALLLQDFLEEHLRLLPASVAEGLALEEDEDPCGPR